MALEIQLRIIESAIWIIVGMGWLFAIPWFMACARQARWKCFNE